MGRSDTVFLTGLFACFLLLLALISWNSNISTHQTARELAIEKDIWKEKIQLLEIERHEERQLEILFNNTLHIAYENCLDEKKATLELEQALAKKYNLVQTKVLRAGTTYDNSRYNLLQDDSEKQLMNSKQSLLSHLESTNYIFIPTIDDANNFLPNSLSDNTSSNNNVVSIDAISESFMEKEKRSVIVGKYSYGTHDQWTKELANSFCTFLILEHPIDRVFRQFLEHKSTIDKDITLYNFVKDITKYQNVYSKYLANSGTFDYENENTFIVTDEQFKTARRNLISSVFLIRNEETTAKTLIDEFEKLFNWPVSVENKQTIREDRSRLGSKVLNDHDRGIIILYNVWDTKLYEFAVRLKLAQNSL